MLWLFLLEKLMHFPVESVGTCRLFQLLKQWHKYGSGNSEAVAQVQML